MTLFNLLPAKVQPYAKAIVAAIGAVLSVLAVTFTDITWIPVAFSILVALGVYQVPNKDKEEQENE